MDTTHTHTHLHTQKVMGMGFDAFSGGLFTLRLIVTHLGKRKWSELKSCVKVKVDILGPPSLIVLMVSVVERNI